MENIATKKDIDNIRKTAKIFIEAGNSANKVADLLENENSTDDEIEAAIGLFIVKAMKIKEIDNF